MTVNGIVLVQLDAINVREKEILIISTQEEGYFLLVEMAVAQSMDG